MPASRYLITAALYILKNERRANWKQFQPHVMLIQKTLTGCANAASLDYSEGQANGPHIARACVCVCARARVTQCVISAHQFARFERVVRHPARNRRLCTERVIVLQGWESNVLD